VLPVPDLPELGYRANWSRAQQQFTRRHRLILEKYQNPNPEQFETISQETGIGINQLHGYYKRKVTVAPKKKAKTSKSKSVKSGKTSNKRKRESPASKRKKLKEAEESLGEESESSEEEASMSSGETGSEPESQEKTLSPKRSPKQPRKKQIEKPNHVTAFQARKKKERKSQTSFGSCELGSRFRRFSF